MRVDVRNLYKVFGATPALDNVSLTVTEGEFVALLGPSGAGKTSLLRLLAGLEFAQSGQILIGGRPMDGVPARARRIGFVFQHYALFRHMTVATNVAFGLTVRPRRSRPNEQEIRRRVDGLLEMMDIGGLAGRYPDQLSGGQRQRVALARALATEPGLLLLDEPFGALDAKVRKSLRVWLRELHDRMGITSIFVTHDQSEAMQMADRVAVMRAGRIEQIDTPDRLYACPANPFVHEFLGESIRLGCHVLDGRVRFDLVRSAEFVTNCPNGPAIALIRPDEIELRRRGSDAEVQRIQADGPLLRLRVSVSGHKLELLRPRGSWVPCPGESCGLDLSQATIYSAGPDHGRGHMLRRAHEPAEV